MAVFNFNLTGKNAIKVKLNYIGSPAPVVAAYIYRLKSKQSNTPLEEFTGDNQNSEDDIKALPQPLADNKDRYLIISNEISAFNADTKYAIQIQIEQDGVVTNTFEDKGEVKLNEPSHGKTILIKIN